MGRFIDSIFPRSSYSGFKLSVTGGRYFRVIAIARIFTRWRSAVITHASVGQLMRDGRPPPALTDRHPSSLPITRQYALYKYTGFTRSVTTQLRNGSSRIDLLKIALYCLHATCMLIHLPFHPNLTIRTTHLP